MLIRTDSDTYAEASLWDCVLTTIHQNTKALALFKAINSNWQIWKGNYALVSLEVIRELINFLNTRIHDTYFEDQNEKDISILLDRDLPL